MWPYNKVIVLMLSHKYGSAHESVVGSLYSCYNQQGLIKQKFCLSLSWQPLVRFYVAMAGDEQTLLIVSNSGKMATETYTFLKIVYGNEGLSHMCACL